MKGDKRGIVAYVLVTIAVLSSMAVHVRLGYRLNRLETAIKNGAVFELDDRWYQAKRKDPSMDTLRKKLTELHGAERVRFILEEIDRCNNRLKALSEAHQ